jgi:hypothetical protein
MQLRDTTRNPSTCSRGASMTTFNSIALAAALAVGLATTSSAFAQPPPSSMRDPADPRSAGAVVTPENAGKDASKDMRDKKKDPYNANRGDGTGSSGTSSYGNPTSPRPPASDGSGRY